MPDHTESSIDYRIKLQNHDYNGQKLKGIFLDLKEYALLTGKPYQAVVEECNNSNNRKLFRKSIYLKKEKKIFLYGRKPLYTAVTARVFRLELQQKNPNNNYDLTECDDSISRGYWINKKEYAELTNQTLSIVTTQTQNNRVEFGQIFKKEGGEYSFFIPISDEDYTSNDIEMFKIKITLKNISEIFEQIQSQSLKERATKLGSLVSSSPQIITFLEEFSSLTEKDIYNMKRIIREVDADEFDKIKKMAEAYSKLFN